MTAWSLLTRGPFPAEPPEALQQTVPVGKRTAPEVQEKVAPRRAGIRLTSPFLLLGAEGKGQKEVDEWRAQGIEQWAAIERPDGRVVDFLLDHGVMVYPVNPKALDRARDRFRQSGGEE